MNLFKPTILGVLLSFITFTLYGQAPQSFSYQAVIRDESGSLVQEEVISVQISIKQGSVDGAIIYAERHAALTNQNGLITLKIGEGSASTGEFQEIDWSNSPFYIETSVDLDGGTNYSIVTTSELLSVPFALYADMAQRSEKADYSDRALIADSVLNLPSNLVRQENQQLELRGDTLFLSDSNFVVVPGLGGIKSVKKPLKNSFPEVSIKFIITTSDGGYMLSGITPYNFSLTQDNVWVAKLDTNFNREWVRTYGGSESDIPNTIIQTSDSGYLIVGITNSDDGDVTDGNNGESDFWVLKLDSNGNKEWDKTYGGSESDIPNTVIQTSDSGYLIVGITNSDDGDVTDGNNGESDFWVLKLDSNGNKEWDKTYGGSESDIPNTVIQTSDSGYLIAGITNSDDGDVDGLLIDDENTPSVRKGWVLKLDSNGNKEWNELLSSINNIEFSNNDDLKIYVYLPPSLNNYTGQTRLQIITYRKNGTYFRSTIDLNRNFSYSNSSLIDLNEDFMVWMIGNFGLLKSTSRIYKSDLFGNILWVGELPFNPSLPHFYFHKLFKDSFGNLIAIGENDTFTDYYGNSITEIFKFYPKGLGYQMN